MVCYREFCCLANKQFNFFFLFTIIISRWWCLCLELLPSWWICPSTGSSGTRLLSRILSLWVTTVDLLSFTTRGSSDFNMSTVHNCTLPLKTQQDDVIRTPPPPILHFPLMESFVSFLSLSSSHFIPFLFPLSYFLCAFLISLLYYILFFPYSPLIPLFLFHFPSPFSFLFSTFYPFFILFVLFVY